MHSNSLVLAHFRDGFVWHTSSVNHTEGALQILQHPTVILKHNFVLIITSTLGSGICTEYSVKFHVLAYTLEQQYLTCADTENQQID